MLCIRLFCLALLLNKSPFTYFELGINGHLYGMDNGLILVQYAGDIRVFDAGKLVLCLIDDGLRHHQSRHVWRYTLYDVIHCVNDTGNATT